MTTPRTCQTFARYNSWMNGKIYKACAELDDAERKADRGALDRHNDRRNLLLAGKALHLAHPSAWPW